MSITTYFRDDSKRRLETYQSQKQILKDKLARLDVKIDRIDEVIKNIDRGIPLEIAKINNSINSVKQSYESRISSGCRSDLIWSPVALNVTTIDATTGTASTSNTYTVIKDPSQQITYPYSTAKYYRKPKNRDYGASFICTFTGTLASEFEIAIVGLDTYRSDIKIKDTIVDDIDDPKYYTIGFFPEIVGFGTTEIVAITTSFSGSVSSGSSIVVVSVGNTGNINLGDDILLDNILQIRTKVVGFTTGFTNLSIFDYNINNFISTGRIAPALIIDKISIGTTENANFSVGLYKTFSSIKTNIPPSKYFQNLDFDVIRYTGDYTVRKKDNPIDPITIGELNSSTVGIGHLVKYDDSGDQSQKVKWRDASKEKEPDFGGGTAVYYEGVQSWPVIGVPPLVSYVSEGTTVTVNAEGPQPGYTNVSPTNASESTCNSINAQITTRESQRGETISNSVPSINALIAKAQELRTTRDELEGIAFSYAREIKTASDKIDLSKASEVYYTNADFSSYETFNYNISFPQ